MITNRKAAYEYHILDRVEAGIVLSGSEVKSLRDNRASIEGSYISVQSGEVFIVGMSIEEFSDKDVWGTHEPKRRRKLLLNRKEIRKFAEKADQKGFTIVPLKVYFTETGFAKVEIAVVQGKKTHDKRESEKKKQVKKDLDRYSKNRK